MVARHSDIQPGELALTLGDGTLMRKNPGSKMLVMRRWRPDGDGVGQYLGNSPVLVLAAIPDGEDVAVMVMAGESFGWMWAHELYARIPSPPTYACEDAPCSQVTSSSAGSGGMSKPTALE
jgi:hypothetical protein